MSVLMYSTPRSPQLVTRLAPSAIAATPWYGGFKLIPQKLQTVLESEAVLIRTKKPVAPVKAEQGESLCKRIDGVLATRDAKYIMLNAPSSALPAITKLLPGAEAPTILPLHGRPGHFAVHAVCRESVFWETLQKLKKVGASAILVLPIEKMLP